MPDSVPGPDTDLPQLKHKIALAEEGGKITLDISPDGFASNFDRAAAITLARRILANVADAYTEEQLNDIGTRARHWVMKLGLSQKLYLDGVVASRLGQDMAEKARHAVAKASDDPARLAKRKYSSEADMTVSVGEAV